MMADFRLPMEAMKIVNCIGNIIFIILNGFAVKDFVKYRYINLLEFITDLSP